MKSDKKNLVSAVPSGGLQTAPLEFALVFHDMTETPTVPSAIWHAYYSALIFNQCDGYHHVFARFESDTCEFLGFFDWCGTEPYEPDKHYCAWAFLPDTGMLEGFRRKGPYIEAATGTLQ